jgi:Flp pilus assembly protein TadD
VLAADPGNLTALLDRGNARKEAGDFDGAAADFGAVLTQRPRSAEVLASLGSAQLGQGLLNESARTFRQVLELDPDSDKACAGLGQVLVLQGRQADAVEEFRRALALNPASRRAKQGLAAALAATGQREEAEAAYRKELEENPGDTGAALALARILLESRRYDEVVALMEAAIRSGADLPEIHSTSPSFTMKAGRISSQLPSTTPSYLWIPPRGRSDIIWGAFTPGWDGDRRRKSSSRPTWRVGTGNSSRRPAVSSPGSRARSRPAGRNEKAAPGAAFCVCAWKSQNLRESEAI